MLHSAGLVHNGISKQSIVNCSTGYKLGDYSTLQRHGENIRMEQSRRTRMAPELQQSVLQIERLPVKCDFATDVWCLGALLSDLVLGKLPAGDPSELETYDGAGDEVAALLCRMLDTESSSRPVIDVVLQDAIRCLYFPKDCETSPHETLDFDSPLKPCRPVVGNSTLKNDDFEPSPLHGAKARRLNSFTLPARRCATAADGDEDAELAPESSVKQESPHHSNDHDGTESTSRNCECRCVVQ